MWARFRLTQDFESRTFKTSSHGPTSVPDPPPCCAPSKPGDGKLGLGTTLTVLFRRVSCSIASAKRNSSSWYNPPSTIWMLISDAGGETTSYMRTHSPQRAGYLFLAEAQPWARLLGRSGAAVQTRFKPGPVSAGGGYRPKLQPAGRRRSKARE